METMEAVKDTANPVGMAIELESVNLYIEELIKKWNETKETVAWYKVWYRVSLNRVTTFLMAALDDLIGYVDDVVEKNADKKATVLAAIEKLYDYVIAEAMPIWMKPFAGSIKSYIISTLISNAIDWMVDKYRNGAWRMNKGDDNQINALWAASQAAKRI